MAYLYNEKIFFERTDKRTNGKQTMNERMNERMDGWTVRFYYAPNFIWGIKSLWRKGLKQMDETIRSDLP